MGRGRARIALGAALGLLVLAAAGCGAQSHPNEPRPEPPTRVSVTIAEGTVTVQPGQIGTGPNRTQQIPQNQNHGQPQIHTDKPLDVIFVTSNQTRFDSHLELHGPMRANSETVFANSPGSFQANLPAGVYTISAADIPGARPGKLVVGRFRASSQNDVLLP
jgi:hypothetical protein